MYNGIDLNNIFKKCLTQKARNILSKIDFHDAWINTLIFENRYSKKKGKYLKLEIELNPFNYYGNLIFIFNNVNRLEFSMINKYQYLTYIQEIIIWSDEDYLLHFKIIFHSNDYIYIVCQKVNIEKEKNSI